METNPQASLPSLLGAEANPESQDLAKGPAVDAKVTEAAGDKNENSVMSFWSSSNSDSDDFNEQNKMDAAADQGTRRGRKGHGRRRRNSQGSKNDALSGSDHERKEYEGRRANRRSRSRDNSPLNDAFNAGLDGGADPEGGDDGNNANHHRRQRSNGSQNSRGSSQDRAGRYESRRRSGNQRKDIGAMGPGGPGGNQRGPGAPNFRNNHKKRDGEYTNKGFFWPSMSKPQVSLQQFSSLQTRQTDAYAIRGQFKQYVKEHAERHSIAFYREHEKEPWFMETYNPMTIYQIKLDQLAQLKKKANEFFAKIPFDLLDLTKRDDSALDGPQLHKFDPNSRTLYLKQIPVFVARVQLKEAVASITTGFDQIIFSKPLQMNNFERFAWLVYNTEEEADAAITELETIVIRGPNDNESEDFKLTPIKNNQTVKPPKVTPEMALDHVARDIDLCKRLIKEVFDVEKEVEFPFEKLESDVESPEAKLDTLLLYLRQVHGYCFFSGVKCEDERTLAGKCGSQYLRLPPSVERVVFDSSALYGSARQFEQNYIAKAEEILQKGPAQKPSDPQEDEILVEKKNQYCIEKTRLIDEGRKYVCVICEKAFRSTDFVVKHIKNKHNDRLVSRFNYSYFKQMARENFVLELKKNQDASPQPTFSHTNFNNRGGDNNQMNEGNGRQFNEFREERGGYRGGRGRGGHRMNNQNSMGMMHNDNNQFGGNGMDGAQDLDGDKRKETQAQREYVDYDDPMQFDREGQRITGQQQTAQLQQQQQQQLQQQQMMMHKTNAANQGGHTGDSSNNQRGGDRQLVSYDDLF